MTTLTDSFKSCARASSALALAVAMLTPATASAQEAAQQTPQAADEQHGLAEIVVTAQRRAENLQNVPIAVSAMTAATLADTGINATSDLPQVIPSVQFTRSGPSGLFFVRGVGTTNAAAGEEGANAVYVDGVYMADLGQTINNFNNIERIEVLKGPQGTLFGRNATGGLVHIITRDPGDEYVMKGEIGAANYETVQARAYVAGPIADGISADLALTRYHQNEGWGRNLTHNEKNFIQSYGGARTKIVARPNDDIKLTLSGDYLKNRDNPVGWRIADRTIGAGGYYGPGVPNAPIDQVIADGHDTTANDLALTTQEAWGGSLTGEVDFGFASLTSITAYRETTTNSDFDVDGGPDPLLRIKYESGMRSIQQELRLASNSTEPFSWQVGAFYLNTKAHNDSLFFSGGSQAQQVIAELDSNSYAVFGEATYSITPSTKATGGIRYTKDKRKFDGSSFVTGIDPFNRQTDLKYDQVTWRLALRQELADDVSIYASANKGFKSGSFSLQSPRNDPYLPQSIMAYEAGVKSELFDRRLRLNLSGFHYKIDDYQVRSAAVGSTGNSLVLNAATVKVDGVELEFEAAPIDNLRLFGGVTWVDSRFSRFGGPGQVEQAPIIYPVIDGADRDAICTANGTANPGVTPEGTWTGGWHTCFGDVSGNKVSNAPEWAATFGATYTVPVSETGELRFTGLYAYNDGYYFEPDNRLKQKSFHLLNASVEYRPTENLGIEIWGRNLTNVDYSAQTITTGIGATAGSTQSSGAPRTYGVNLKFDF